MQLNINNPNFLIMQGRITKVLNMKPVEILAMIEEAAGTRMFEDRKEKALKTMAKKNKKMDEINELLKEEIDPKLDKLRGEKRAFLDFQQTQSDLERLQKLVVSYDYVHSTKRAKRAERELDEKKARVVELDANSVKLKHEIKNLEEDIRRVTTQRDKELRNGGRFQALEQKVTEKSHEMVRLQTSLDMGLEAYTDEQNKRENVRATVKDLKESLGGKVKAYERLKDVYDGEKKLLDASTAEMYKKEELLQTLLTGVGSKEGQESGYQGQLQDAKNHASAAATEQEQAKLKIAHLEKRLKEEEPRVKKAREQNSTLTKELDGLRAQAQKLETEIAKLDMRGSTEEDMQKEEIKIHEQIRDLSHQADNYRKMVSQIDFDYADPAPNWDRGRVKGLVAELFTVREDKQNAGTALEVSAGGRLYNVVVDTEVTGSLLLSNGKLKKRVTIIPLNKIMGSRASGEVSSCPISPHHPLSRFLPSVM